MMKVFILNNQIGHTAAEVAQYLYPLLSSYRVTWLVADFTSYQLDIINVLFSDSSWIASQPYSSLEGNRSWRYRALDLHISISGSLNTLDALKTMLSNKNALKELRVSQICTHI